MRRTALIPLAIIAVLLSACSTDESAPAPTAKSTANPLSGTAWALVSYAQGANGPATKVPSSVTATATFDEKQVSGKNGCNTYSGAYSVNGDQIRFTDVATTLIGCTGAAARVEAVFTTVLASAQTFTVDDTSLTIVGEGDNGSIASLTFKPATAASLTGTKWTATGINNGKQAVSSLVADTNVTAEFGDDGTIAGNAGCNNYNGPYTVDGKDLSFGELATTKKLCEDAVNSQETAYLNALKATTTFTIRGGTLELRDDEGALQVSYKAP